MSSPGQLHQLEAAGYLGRLNRVVNGKVRKYYVLTRRGGTAPRHARPRIGEPVEGLLEADIAKKGAQGRPASARTRRSGRRPGRSG